MLVRSMPASPPRGLPSATRDVILCPARLAGLQVGVRGKPAVCVGHPDQGRYGDPDQNSEDLHERDERQLREE